MHCHCGTNNRAPRWTFTDPYEPEEQYAELIFYFWLVPREDAGV